VRCEHTIAIKIVRIAREKVKITFFKMCYSEAESGFHSLCTEKNNRNTFPLQLPKKTPLKQTAYYEKYEKIL